MNKSVVHLRPKSSSMPGQLHLPTPLFAQQNPTQLNVPHEALLPLNHPIGNLPPPPNPLVNPIFLPPQQLVNPQLSVIPSSILASTATYLPFPNIPQQNLVNSPQARLVPCPTAPKRPFNSNPYLKLWSFAQNTLPKSNKLTNNAAVFYNFNQHFPQALLTLPAAMPSNN